MATANIRAVITAEDRGSAVVKNFGNSVGKSTNHIVKQNQRTKLSFNQVLVATAGAAVAARGLVGVINDTVRAANKEQAALVGLSSIAKAFGQDTKEATKAAQDLTKDGLLNIADAARGLKNLLQSGFSLPQAIKLMERFKDSAAFGRQNALSFGDAVASATEGIKNGNSILVDNAGVTKNLSIILREAGFAETDLMRATSDANVRQALFNGLIKETNAQVGDAQKLTGLYAGKQAELEQKTFILKSTIGQALQPILFKLLETITPLVEKFARFAEDNPKLVASVLLITTVTIGLIAVLGTLGLAIKGMTPIFAGFAVAGKASVAGVRASFIGLRALVATPIAMPAIAVGAALIAINKVINSYRQLQREISAAKSAMANIPKYNQDFFNSLDRALSEGRISRSEYNRRKESYISSQKETLRTIAGQRASGGMVNNSQPYMVGERGPELFVPSQSGTVVKNSQAGAPTINLNLNIGMYAGSEREKRKIATELMRAFEDVKGTKLAWS